MATKKWSEIRAQRFTPEELDQIDREIASELLEEERVGSSGPNGPGEWSPRLRPKADALGVERKQTGRPEGPRELA